MKKLPVALQLYTVREEASADLLATLSKVADMGYDGVEFAGFFGVPSEEIIETLGKLGLKAASAHIGLPDLEKPEILAYVRDLKLPYAAIPAVPEAHRVGGPEYADFLKRAKAVSAVLKGMGTQLLYHNHAFEFEKVNGVYALDQLYLDMTADELQTQIDTCWVNRGGENPSEYLRKYTGRAPVVHLKDFALTPEFEFRPVGDGLQDLPALLTAANDAGALWLVVEQDRWPTMSALDSARRSLENIRKAQG